VHIVDGVQNSLPHTCRTISGELVLRTRAPARFKETAIVATVVAVAAILVSSELGALCGFVAFESTCVCGDRERY
jgi:hypothetical protein